MPQPYAENLREMERQARRREKTGEGEPMHNGWRPQVRSDCANMQRPCPFVGCKFHLFLDVGREGQIKYNFGNDVSVLEKMRDTCALDVAREGGLQLEEIGMRMNVTRERIRQQEAEAMTRLRKAQACVRAGDTDMREGEVL